MFRQIAANNRAGGWRKLKNRIIYPSRSSIAVTVRPECPRCRHQLGCPHNIQSRSFVGVTAILGVLSSKITPQAGCLDAKMLSHKEEHPDRHVVERKIPDFASQHKYTKSVLYKKPSTVRFLRQALKLY
jgi:hypothetical protein